MRRDHSMYLTAELHVFWAKCWGLKEAEWRIWSEVCIEAVERPGWQQCGYFRPWYVVMQTFTALKTYFQLISFPSRRELFEKREPYQNFLSSLIIKSLHKSLVFFLLSYGKFPLTDDAWGFSRQQQRVKRHCSWASLSIPQYYQRYKEIWI